MGADRSTRRIGCGELVEGKPLAESRSGGDSEASGVAHLASVETERLLIEVAKQMERFDGDVGALQGALQQRPKVLAAVGVDLPVHVAFGMVYGFSQRVAAALRAISRRRSGLRAAARACPPWEAESPCSA